MERKKTTLYVVMLAMMMALCCVLTVFVQIPMGNGYVNFGDAVIFLAASLLGPVAGAIVGGIGSALADIFSGYVVYAAFTLVVKAAEGFVCGWGCTNAFFTLKNGSFAVFFRWLSVRCALSRATFSPTGFCTE